MSGNLEQGIILLPLRNVSLHGKLRGEMALWRQNGGHQKGHQFGFLPSFDGLGMQKS